MCECEAYLARDVGKMMDRGHGLGVGTRLGETRGQLDQTDLCLVGEARELGGGIRASTSGGGGGGRLAWGSSGNSHQISTTPTLTVAVFAIPETAPW